MRTRSLTLVYFQGKFSLQPNSLKNTFVVGYDSIAGYIQEISERINRGNDSDDGSFAHVPEEDLKAYKKSDIKLLIASSIVSEIRAAVKEQTGYECSAGIAHNKILAKLVCGLNKPNKQTILPLKHIPQLFRWDWINLSSAVGWKGRHWKIFFQFWNPITIWYFLHSTLPVRKVQGLGGKFGEKICEDLSIQHMGELVNVSKEELLRRYDERNGQWLYNIARGIDLEAVTPRLVSKSIGCCKKFPGRNAIAAMTTLNHWLHELASEIVDRLEQDEMENNRRPKQMVVTFVQTINNVDVSSSRTVNLTTLDEEKIVGDAVDVLKRNTDKFFKSPDNLTVLNNPIKFLGLNVGKFESTDVKKGNTIQNMFKRTIDNQMKDEAAQKADSSSKELTKDQSAEAKDEVNNTVDELAGDEPTTVKDAHEVSETNKDDQEESVTVQYADNGDESPKNDISKSKSPNGNDQREKDESKISFFANFQRMKKQKEAEEEQARKAEEERQRIENESNVEEENGEENMLENDMLLEELEQNNQSLQRPNTPNNNESSSKRSYTETYAEFYTAPVTFEVPKVKCTQCGKQVNAHDIQIHTDAHFAFQLSQEQSAEYQSQLKRTASSTTPAAKKSKTSAKTPQKMPSIQKFLVKPEDQPAASSISPSTPSASMADDVETQRCTECGKFIPIVDLFEHMDFHAAKKLQDEWMKADRANRVNNNTTQKSNNKNTGKKTTNKKKTAASNSKPGAMKNISSFFQDSWTFEDLKLNSFYENISTRIQGTNALIKFYALSLNMVNG